ncbi:MAG: prolyl oligopeptidase family serine peptidase [Verrucomicrobiota bacterium]
MVAEEVREATDDLKLKPGKNLLRINYEGVRRDLYIELPQDVASGRRYPIVFGFHGDGGTMNAYRKRLSPFVEKFKIIGVSIQGIVSRGESGLASWNYYDSSAVNIDDIAFITYLVEYLVKSGVGDMTRVYATGGSSGGLLSYRLAVDTDLFAAIAPTKCGMIKGHHEPNVKTVPLSVMQCIGNEDKSFNGSSKRLTMYSAEKRVKIWRKFLKCKPDPIVDETVKGMTIKRYTNKNGEEVVYCMLHGVGHNIPNSVRPIMDQLIINFFMKHKKAEKSE